MTDREPTSVPINLLEAFDNREPTNEEIERALRVLAVARRALEASGIAVRWNTHLQAPEAGDSEDPGINLDTVPVDEVALLVTRGRLQEVDEVAERINELLYDTQVPGTRILIRLLKYLDARGNQLGGQGWEEES